MHGSATTQSACGSGCFMPMLITEFSTVTDQSFSVFWKHLFEHNGSPKTGSTGNWLPGSEFPTPARALAIVTWQVGTYREFVFFDERQAGITVFCRLFIRYVTVCLLTPKRTETCRGYGIVYFSPIDSHDYMGWSYMGCSYDFPMTFDLFGASIADGAVRCTRSMPSSTDGSTTRPRLKLKQLRDWDGVRPAFHRKTRGAYDFFWLKTYLPLGTWTILSPCLGGTPMLSKRDWWIV